MVWKIDDPQGNEAAKIKWEIVEYTRGRGLDLGCGQFKAFPHFTGVDNGHHWGMKGVDVHVDTCEDLSIFSDRSMDFIFSSHLLEHIVDTRKTLKEWFRVLKPEGYLVLYLPHKELYPNIGQEGANTDHKHDFLPEDIEGIMKDIGSWDLVRNETKAEGFEYSFFQVYKKLSGTKHRYSYKEPKPEKTCAVIRYGAFGDLIQTSSILPSLKKEGYHITLYTSTTGYDVIKNDPHIDKFVVQDTNQVPNQDLVPFWGSIKKKYDRFINLSESVEGSLLAMPGRPIHGWSHAARHRLLNRNYLEVTHDIAEVPHDFRQKFYPTEDEKFWAKNEKKKIGGTVILWSLAGSAVHKTWPHLDAALAYVLITYPDAKIVLVGDTLCQMLEHEWTKEPRVIRRSGVWNIRQSLTFAQISDMVIGSETGVLNAVGMEQVPKIVMLSHSSVENLTKHWVNTISLEPKTSCYPCHQMHFNFEHCRRDMVLGTAQCQSDISPLEVYGAIDKILRKAA